MKTIFYIDAGVEHLHLKKYELGGDAALLEKTIKVDDTIEKILDREGLWQEMKSGDVEIFTTGKLASIIIKAIGHGREIVPAAAIWSAVDFLHGRDASGSIGIIDLSASGYMAISVDNKGQLVEDNLVVNPRCGAGSGTNLSRILHKLDISKTDVDNILKKFLGEEGRTERQKISVRADRCGVFSSSATVSDKNQGIPLEDALAVTLKSEVLKAVKKLAHGVELVYLTGRVFNWQFARECATDYLESIGTKRIVFDDKQSLLLDGVRYLADKIGVDNFKSQEDIKVAKVEAMMEYPSFGQLFKDYSDKGLYFRDSGNQVVFDKGKLIGKPVSIGLDIGSTMAKIIIADAVTHEPLYLESYDNHGDTIETVKHIFCSLEENGVEALNLQQVGITGSGRYQVQKILAETYPHLRERIHVLVENYAHARGSLGEAKEMIRKLKAEGKAINEDFCLLVDVGGEDTKISVVSMKDEDLYDNAMNIKCSAGTGSLMDTLSSMFSIPSVKTACQKAMAAEKAYGINATCAVFLIENARKLQAQGYEQNEILASCYWAIVENMARTLWSQIDFPKNALALLHGQTMLSDPLPLAITQRLQEYTGSTTHAYVPPFPGHRACFGLIKGLPKQEIIDNNCKLSLFTDRQFAKRIFICRGAACGDKNACCTRSLLTYTDQDGAQKFIPLGGCTSVNEKEARAQQGNPSQTTRKDTYKEIWQLIDNTLKKDEAENRLVIPRSFAGSEQAFFFQEIFSYFDIPVHIDNVQTSDVLEAQPRISIDTCAPVIGAIGQFSRLAREKHGIIFVPQIDYLPTGGKSLGRTCTTNQGGVVIAMDMAKENNKDANFFLVDISLSKKEEIDSLSQMLLTKLEKIFEFYGKRVVASEMVKAVTEALRKEKELKESLCDYAAKEITTAATLGKKVVVISGREYILNPGIYDSHAGRLFSDKGVVAIPSFIFNGDLSSDYSSVYWRNPHHILSIIDAVSQKKLHQMTKNANLAEALSKLENEQGTSQPIGTIYVSTFRCGPDSMILQTAQELAKDIPFLIIQSDAAINELAHLENRVNTYLGQLSADNAITGHGFKVEFLDKFSADSLDKEKDVIYFPTMEDNRALTSVLRSAGYYCIDNYNDETYDLQKIIKYGRRFTGDAVCAPFAAVFADTLLAVEDFVKRIKSGEIKDKSRLIVFNNKGTGPCRQGQYYEMHRMLLYKELAAMLNGLAIDDLPIKDISVQYIVGHEKNNYNIGLEPWALLQAYHSVVMQGVLHASFFQASRVCNSLAEYQDYRKDFLALKQDIFRAFENIKPKPAYERMLKATAKIPVLNFVSLYLFSGIRNNNGLPKILRNFSEKWNLNNAPHRSLKIYAEGEAYMRVAQIEEVYKQLIDDIGINSFEFSYSPMWLYTEYLMENRILETKEKQALKFEWKNYFKILSLRAFTKIFRLLLVRPLYRAASLPEPIPMDKVLMKARKILTTNKPYGELAPYVGEALVKLESGTELFLNIAPEGCMVATMGEMLTKSIYSATDKKPNARIQGIFSTDGEISNDKLVLALMKILSPEGYYRKS